jgi:AraC-like DNA-binding protein
MTTLARGINWRDVQTQPSVKARVDAFGCSAASLARDHDLPGAGMKFFRKANEDQKLGSVATSADDRGFLVGVSQSSGHRRRIFHEHHATTHEFVKGSIYVRNLHDDYRADMYEKFDFVLLEISRGFLTDVAEEHELGSDVNLAWATGTVDIALSALVHPLLPRMEAQQPLDRLLIDQLETSIALHLLRRQNARPVASMRPSSSRAQISIAMEMLDDNLDGNLPVAELARACGLSRGYFIRAFRNETGLTPHQWLLYRRLDRARALLIGSRMSLADIAGTCGFADQSHFTRLFSRMVGLPPGNWRRQSRN